VARTLIPGFGSAKINEIVSHKHRWDVDETPLIDGSLPQPGPFDQESDTVASATKSSEGWKELQFIYSCVLLKKPSLVLELGTNVGFSSAYIGSALKALGRQGRIHTVDASPYKMRLAKKLHEQLGLNNVDYTVGLFYEVLPGLLSQLKGVDLAFIDGQHEYKATWDFFEMISEVAAPGALLIFDDISGYSEGMDRVWRQVRADPRVFASSELGNIGLVLKAG
jgi:predicted O-methyltransferase YrrM